MCKYGEVQRVKYVERWGVQKEESAEMWEVQEWKVEKGQMRWEELERCRRRTDVEIVSTSSHGPKTYEKRETKWVDGVHRTHDL